MNLPRRSAETPCSLGFEPQNPRYIHLRHSLRSYLLTKTQVRMLVAQLSSAYDLIKRLSYTIQFVFVVVCVQVFYFKDWASTFFFFFLFCLVLFCFFLRSQTSGSGWLSPRKLCWSSRRSVNSGNATMTRSCCWPSPKLKMYRWERRGTKLRKASGGCLNKFRTLFKKQKCYEGKILSGQHESCQWDYF